MVLVMERKIFKIKLASGKLIVDYALVCNDFFSKLRGLMFRGNNFKTPLLFVFAKPGKYAIHSFFCKKFYAVWMLNGKIVAEQIVEPWKVSVVPKKEFDMLLEIPAKSL
jgi:uncharacterized membrane protein (UPF0127 family)